MKKTYAEFWHGVCQNRDEELIAENISVSMPEIPLADSVVFTGISNGRRNTEKQASLYDCMMAEIMAEKEKRMRKFMRKHELRNDGKPVRKEKRKSYRKERYYGSQDFYCGFQTIAEIRRKEAKEADARDYIIEQENIADDAERKAIDAEIREWELRRAVDDANRRAWMAIQDWLEWA